MIIIHIIPDNILLLPWDEKNCNISCPVAKPDPIHTDINAPDNKTISLMFLVILTPSYILVI